MVQATRLEFLRTAERHEFAILAYVFMPDHMHALVEGRAPTSDLRRFVTLFRRRSALATSLSVPRGLWQDGYFERILRKAEETEKVIDYILNNPVRAGLVELAVEYPFSWSCSVDYDPRR